MNADYLINEAVSLPVEARALMVDLLLRSLNQPESEVDKKWAKEATRRLADLRSGRLTAVPGDQVFKKVWQRFE